MLTLSPAQIVPATFPVILLGTGIFFTLTLLQTHLSHSRSLEDSAARITALEDELRELRESQKRQAVNWSAGTREIGLICIGCSYALQASARSSDA